MLLFNNGLRRSFSRRNPIIHGNPEEYYSSVMSDKLELIFQNASPPYQEPDEETPHLAYPPGDLSDVKNMDIQMDINREPIDFENELLSISEHQDSVQRPQLRFIINKIYIPKFKAKCFYPGMLYRDKEFYHTYYKQPAQPPSRVFGTQNQKSDEEEEGVIVGVNCAVNDPSVAVVDSKGKVKQVEQTVYGFQNFKGNRTPDQKHEDIVDSLVEKVSQTPNIKAVAVTIGPGHHYSLRLGIKAAAKLAKKLDVKLIPVNGIEANILALRHNVSDACKDTLNTDEAPREQQYPYISVVIRNKETQLVLTRGIGNHVILGFDMDSGVSQLTNKVMSEMTRRREIFFNKDAWKKYIYEYNNRKASDKRKKISNPAEEKEPLNAKKVLESIALLGDPTKFELACPMKNHNSVDFSFTGLQTSALKYFYAPGATGPLYEREPAVLEVQDFCDLAASIQFVIATHICDNLETALNWAYENDLGVNQVHLVGGASTNKYYRKRISDVVAPRGLKFFYPEDQFCEINAANVAWTGWELLNIGEEVDISDMPPYPMKKLPVGSYVYSMKNLKYYGKFKTKNQMLATRMLNEDRELKNRIRTKHGPSVNNMTSLSFLKIKNQIEE